MSIFAEQVASLLDAVAIGSGPDFTWLGVPDDGGDQSLTGQIDNDILRAEFARRLTRRIYQDFYCSGEIRRANDPDRSADVRRAPMTGLLANANSGAGQWNSGWVVVEELEDGSVLAKQNGLTLRVPADHVRSRIGTSDACPGEVGTGSPTRTCVTRESRIVVKLPKELLGMSPGHYLALGETELAIDKSDFMIRILLEPSPAGGRGSDAAAHRAAQQSGRGFSAQGHGFGQAGCAV